MLPYRLVAPTYIVWDWSLDHVQNLCHTYGQDSDMKQRYQEITEYGELAALNYED